MSADIQLIIKTNSERETARILEKFPTVEMFVYGKANALSDAHGVEGVRIVTGARHVDFTEIGEKTPIQVATAALVIRSILGLAGTNRVFYGSDFFEDPDSTGSESEFNSLLESYILVDDDFEMSLDLQK